MMKNYRIAINKIISYQKSNSNATITTLIEGKIVFEIHYVIQHILSNNFQQQKTVGRYRSNASAYILTDMPSFPFIVLTTCCRQTVVHGAHHNSTGSNADSSL